MWLKPFWLYGQDWNYHTVLGWHTRVIGRNPEVVKVRVSLVPRAARIWIGHQLAEPMTRTEYLRGDAK